MTTTGIVEAWNGPGRGDATPTTVEPHHNALHPTASKLAFEHWYFDARLDTGHVVVGFVTKRRPEDLPGAKPWVELIVYTPEGDRRQVSKRYPRAAAVYLAIGHPAYFRFHSTYELSVHHGGRTDTLSGTTLHELVALK